jgi:UTP--glucose-1-phosphate uridylyltransferase
MIEYYAHTPGHILAVQKITPEESEKYGVIDGDIGARIQGLVEKPRPALAPSNLGVVGRYILQPSIFDALTQIHPSLGELQLTDAIDALTRQEPVYAYSFLGHRYDCGDKLGYLKAILAFGLKHPVVGAAFQAHLASKA